jgi:ABC-type multidrug transport system ATPase subunit
VRERERICVSVRICNIIHTHKHTHTHTHTHTYTHTQAYRFKRYAKYVPQEDNMLGTMTLEETLMFSANLGLADMSAAERTARGTYIYVYVCM